MRLHVRGPRTSSHERDQRPRSEGGLGGTSHFQEGNRMAKRKGKRAYSARGSSVALLCGTLCGSLGCGNGTAKKDATVGTVKSAVTESSTTVAGDRHYTLFEEGAVRPIAVLPGGLVAVTNMPDDRVELFRPRFGGSSHCGSIKVGMRPVA